MTDRLRLGPAPECLPREDYASAIRSPIALKIEDMRRDLERFQAGERSLEATKAWLVARPSEVLLRVPPGRSRSLRAAVNAIERCTPARLPEAVEAVVTELEALLPVWITLAKATGTFWDENHMRERGLA